MKASSHRKKHQPSRHITTHQWCRFSQCGWGIATFLAVYLIFMHSYYLTEHKPLRAYSSLLDDLQHRVASLEQEQQALDAALAGLRKKRR